MGGRATRTRLSSSEVRLAALVGPSTLARGRAYAEQGAVRRADWDSDRTMLSGEVRGTSRTPYQVRARVDRQPGTGMLSRLEARCTCPVGYNCKHAVALFLAAEAVDPALGRPALRLVGGGTGKRDEATASPWAATLDALLRADAADDAGDADHRADGRPRIGLQVELVAERPRRNQRAAPSGPGVRMRLVAPGASGNWVRSGISWGRLDYLWYGRPGSHSEALVVLRELRALASLALNRSWVSYSDDALWLEAIPSRRVWDVLRHASEAGVPLVPSGRRSGPVRLEPEPVDAYMDVVADAGGYSLSAQLASGGRVLRNGSYLLAGSPPHGVVWWDGPLGEGPAPAVHMAPLSGRPDAAVLGLLGRPPLPVPAGEDAEQFARRFLPALARRVALRSTDGSVEVPDPVRDTVVCNLTHLPGPAVQVAWSLEATGEQRPVDDHPDAGATVALDRLASIDGVPADGTLGGVEAALFFRDVLPRVEAVEGVEVRHVGSPPIFREASEAPVVRLGGDEVGGGDWFDLAIEVSVGGEPVPFSDLFVALVEGATHLVLPSGTYFSLDRPDLRQLGELIAEARSLHDSPAGTVRLSRFQSSMWQELCSLGDADAQAGAWSAAVQALAGGDGDERPVPSGLLATLRPYQLTGFQWLAVRFEHGLGGILADDMGLGKTLQVLAMVLHAREKGLATAPFLVVAPTSVVGNWSREAARFAPDLPVVAVTETTKRAGANIADRVAGAGLVVTSYALFRLDFPEYEQLPWAGLVLDEAQFAKNPSSHNYALARRLPATFKLAVTGTPLENSLAELWALTSITAPGLFSRPDRFAETYRGPIERHGDQTRLEQLRRRVRPILLRRTKEEVARDLPSKQEQVLELDLHPRHRRAYQTYLQRERQKVLGLLADMESNRFEILRSLTVLRQAALDVSLVDDEHASVPSTKLDVLSDMLAEAVADGHRVLVFSQFTRFLTAARRRVEAAGIDCCYLDGSTRRRQQVIDQFRDGDVPVFLVSLKAGGFGLNLTEADHCILLDPWWNPATEAQAVDRAHRIGQTRNVMVYRLVARDTIEEKVMALKKRKQALFDSVVGAGGFESAGLSAADVRMLLG